MARLGAGSQSGPSLHNPIGNHHAISHLIDIKVSAGDKAPEVGSHHHFCTDETLDGFSITYPKSEHLS